jgi:hypothetical protein
LPNRPGWANRPGGGGGGEQWRPGGGGNRPDRPWDRPGWGGGGEHWRPGGGNRPGWPNRPGGGGDWAGGGNRPGWGNRPGFGNGNIGSGNIGQIGNNVGIGGGNTNISNISGGNYYGGGNYFGGGGWGGGGWGGGYGGGWGGYSGGWAAPFYGGWYNGFGSNLGSFWGGVGLGALTSWGLGNAFGAASFYSPLGMYGFGGYGFPVYGGYGFGSGFGVYDYFPTWGVSSIADWGLGSTASTWLSGNYVNPYNSVQPASSTVVYDYSQPINITAAPPDPNAADSTEQVFSAARDSFQAGDYQRALDLADQVVKATPNAPVVHEFRALCLFALKRYDDAASAAYAALSAGPCWDWSTLVGLYGSADTYTNQLRVLEAAVRNNLNATPPRFLLAYHYLVQGNTDAAGMEFAIIAKSEPKDQLSGSFAKALTKTKETTPTPATGAPTTVAGAQPATSGGRTLVPTSATVPTASAAGTAPPTAAAPGAGTSASPQPAEAPPPPPAELTGTWKAVPAPDTTVTLALQADGEYTWNVANKGQQQQSIAGRAVYVNDVLSLTQEEGPPLAGKIESKDASKFVFRLMGGGASAPALTFTR